MHPDVVPLHRGTRRRNLVFRSNHEDRLEVLGFGIETGDNLVVAAHNGSEDGPHLGLGFEHRFVAAPFARRINLGLTTMPVRKPSRSDNPILSSSSSASGSIGPDRGTCSSLSSLEAAALAHEAVTRPTWVGRKVQMRRWVGFQIPPVLPLLCLVARLVDKAHSGSRRMHAVTRCKTQTRQHQFEVFRVS